MAKKKATQFLSWRRRRGVKAEAPSRPKRKCGPPKVATLPVAGPLGGRVVTAGMSRYSGKPPQPCAQQKIRKSTKSAPRRMIISPFTRIHHKGDRTPTLSGIEAWRGKYQRGVVSSTRGPSTLRATRRALLCMAPKHASAIADNLEYGRATYDWFFDRFKEANETETEMCWRGGRKTYRPNRFYRSVDPEKWNKMMDEGKVLCRNQISVAPRRRRAGSTQATRRSKCSRSRRRSCLTRARRGRRRRARRRWPSSTRSWAR
jgi:hypothetical protein